MKIDVEKSLIQDERLIKEILNSIVIQMREDELLSKKEGYVCLQCDFRLNMKQETLDRIRYLAGSLKLC